MYLSFRKIEYVICEIRHFANGFPGGPIQFVNLCISLQTSNCSFCKLRYFANGLPHIPVVEKNLGAEKTLGTCMYGTTVQKSKLYMENFIPYRKTFIYTSHHNYSTNWQVPDFITTTMAKNKNAYEKLIAFTMVHIVHMRTTRCLHTNFSRKGQ